MGNDDPPQNPQYNKNNTNQSPYNNSNTNLNSNLRTNNYQVPNDSEKLNPIRRHSNIQNLPNHPNIQFQNQINNSLHSSLTFKKQTSQDLPPVFERSKNRKLSAQYMAEFKKSYMQGDNKYSFLNHLADSLTHGKEIPHEEIEKFKKDYLPKYLLDWRCIQDQQGNKYWKLEGKILGENIRASLDKLGNNKIKSSEPFYLKRCWFFRYLMGIYAKNKTLNPVIEIDRRNILENSYICFSRQHFNLARPLKIKFINEQNDDVDGTYRDWYQSMFKDIISPNKKLFLINPYKSIEPYNIIIYPKYPGMRMELYEFIGKFIIKSTVDLIIIRNFIINKVQLKLITKNQITLEDIKYFNLDLYQKLKLINDTRIAGNKQLETIRFVWNMNNQEIELIPNGRNIFLNDQNKNIFINKVIYVEVIMPYEEQIKYIQKGLYSILGDGIQGVFTAEEMNFMLSGQEDIDLRDLKENIIYKGEYNENHPIIKMFWEKLVTLNKNQLIKFLQFSTGSSAVPIDGFGALKDINGRIQKFTIEPFMNYSAENPNEYKFFPIESKKEYNTIILPKYRNKNELDYAINMIISDTK